MSAEALGTCLFPKSREMELLPYLEHSTEPHGIIFSLANSFALLRSALEYPPSAFPIALFCSGLVYGSCLLLETSHSFLAAQS